MGKSTTPKAGMEWSRSETLALAQQSCSHCYGLGLRPGRGGATTPCNCVFRAIFRACYNRFVKCASKEKYISRVSLEANPGRQRKNVWGMKNEEYIADFCLVARRALTECSYKLFRSHFVFDNDWRACCARFGLCRGDFFHEIYRIEQHLGRIFRELRPYPLFPLDEYFNSSIQAHEPTPFPVFVEPLKKHGILRFPIVRKIAPKVVSIDVKKLPLLCAAPPVELFDLPLAA